MRELILQSNNVVQIRNGSDTLTKAHSNSEISKENFSIPTKIQKYIMSNNKFCSLEFFPQKHTLIADQHETCVRDIQSCQASFSAVTWHLETPYLLKPREIPALRLATLLVNSKLVGPNSVLLHLSSVGLTEYDVRNILNTAKENRICNIFALRGDNECSNKSRGVFAHAVDLVKFIRREFGDYFTICVAGYPLGHPEATSYQQDLIHLKEKVDAGANFIISQIVFNAVCFSQFVKDCRNIDIAVPILPGVMPVQSYKSLERTSSICHIPIPRAILDAVKPIEDNDDAVRNYGIHQAVQMIKEMFSLGCATGIHFFTLNRGTMVHEIWRQLGFMSTSPSRAITFNSSDEGNQEYEKKQCLNI